MLDSVSGWSAPSFFLRVSRRRVVADAAGGQAHDGDVVAADRAQSVQVLAVVGGVALEVRVLRVKHLLRGRQLDGQRAHPSDRVVVAA